MIRLLRRGVVRLGGISTVTSYLAERNISDKIRTVSLAAISGFKAVSEMPETTLEYS